MTTPDAAHDSTNCPQIETSTFEEWVFEISKYHETFVRAGTRKIMDKGNPLQWIPYPVGFGSRGFNALRDDFEPLMTMAVYGCFVNLVKLSTDPPRYGVLAHSDGQPYKLSMIGRITGAPPDLIITTIQWCLRVGWMTATRIGGESQLVDVSTVSQQCATTAPPVNQQQPGASGVRREETQHKETQHEEKRAKGRSPPALVTESPPFDDIEQHWNHSLAVSHTLTDSRRSKLQARWKDAEFRTRWREAIDRIGSSDFCRGLNDRGWKCSLDWFLKSDTITKVLEGNYDNHKNLARPARGNSAAVREDTNGNAFAAVYGPDIFAEDPAGVDAPLFDEENAGTDSAPTRHLGQSSELSFP